MNYKKYQLVLYLIFITIVTTITVQLYWNYRSYQGNKHRVYRGVQRSLDKAVEDYYANITRSRFITFSSDDALLPVEDDTLFIDGAFRKEIRKKLDSTIKKIAASDSSKAYIFEPKDQQFPKFLNMEKRFKRFDSLISKVYISISRDTFDLEKFDTYFQANLARKNYEIDYALSYTNKDYYKDEPVKKYYDKGYITQADFNKKFNEKDLKTKAKSNYINRSSTLQIHFKNTFLIALRKTISGILISLILSLCVITSLIYLLRIIKNQKQLAETKDDLISNITHELKTPITTISAALQALAAFSAMEDKEKTKKYLEVSNRQVNKLNEMVEKILETATLDSDNLLLKKTTIDLVDLLHGLIEKYQLINPEKIIVFNNTLEKIELSIDPFHFENAISNIMDNAVKYGGDFITLSLQLHHENLHIICQDNGPGIDKNQRHKIFDKFYRVPTGNIHNVKGFGIGLYYSKHIIEKHHGSISLTDSTKETIFTIILPLDYG